MGGIDRSKPYLVRVLEHPDLGTWEANWDELTGQWVVCGFLYETDALEFIEVIEPEPVGPVCTCEMLTLWNCGCQCGAVEPYQVPR